VTPEQIERYALPTAPPKATDNRAFSGETCQAEGLAPNVLANILRAAIEQRIDRSVYEKVLRRERRVRATGLGSRYVRSTALTSLTRFTGRRV
jgi:hypothetical protein